MSIKHVLALFLITVISGCGSMKFYHDTVPLEFSNFDYTFTTQTAEVNGVEVAWHDTQKGAGTPVVLIHGLASNAGFWRYNVAALEQGGCRVIAVDLPGFGKSAKPFGAPYSLAFQAGTVASLLQKLGIAKAVWVGHSMGAQIAMTAALNHPTMVERLVLLSPAGFETFKRGEGDWMRNAVNPEFVKRTSSAAVRANLAANFFTWSDAWEWMVEERERMARAKEFDRFCYAVWCSVGAMLDEPVRAKLGRIAVPVLVIGGENDNLIPNPYLHGGFTRDVMEDGVRALPNARLVMLPHAGHMVQIEKAGDVNREVLAFVK